MLELATDGPNLASKSRLLCSDGATITAVIAQWRSLASILTSLQTTLSQGMPLTSIAAEAEALVGSDWMVPASDRPQLAEGEFHLMDLVGLKARLTTDGEPVGTVTDLISGGNDLLEIKRSDGSTVLIPFVEAIVPEVHLNDGWLLLTPPPGLMDL